MSALPSRDHPLLLPGNHSRAYTPDRNRCIPVGLDQPGNYSAVCIKDEDNVNLNFLFIIQILGNE